MYSEKPLGQFLDDLASSAPAPGGGSVAALSGALGAALLSMVCNLTIGKEKYKDVEGDMKEILAQSEKLRRELIDLLQADTQLYAKVIAAYRLPKNTEEEKAARLQAIDAALKEATRVPMEIAERCAKVCDLCVPAVHKGNVSAISDVGVGVIMAEAALVGASLNVQINLGQIKDADFVRRAADTLAGYLKGKQELRDDVMRITEEKL